MSSRKNVQDTHIPLYLPELHRAVLDLVAEVNRPQGDERLLREAGLRLDRALFPLLVLIERYGPIGVVELADRVGRDHTTVSRQVAKLDSLGLVERRAGATDRRVREAIITPSGQEMTERIDAARARIAQTLFADWPPGDVAELVRLMRRFADALAGNARPAGEESGV